MVANRSRDIQCYNMINVQMNGYYEQWRTDGIYKINEHDIYVYMDSIEGLLLGRSPSGRHLILVKL